MHVVYVAYTYITEKNFGGLERYVSNIAYIMRQHGHEVTIITLSPFKGVVFDIFGTKVIRVKKCVRLSKDSPIKWIIDSWGVYKALNRLHHKHPVNIIQVSNSSMPGFFRCNNIPTVIRLSSDNAIWRNGYSKNFDFEKAINEKLFSDRVELYGEKHADSVFAPSRALAQIVEKRLGRKVDVLESPFVMDEMTVDNSNYSELLRDRKYILYVGNLSYMKGFHVVINAIGRLLDKYEELNFVFAGPDFSRKDKGENFEGMLSSLNQQYDGRVIYLGVVKKYFLAAIMKGAFVCVMPSRFDNLPNACIEAMSLGTVVVGTNGASFEQLITDKDNGILIERESSEALIEAIDYLLSLSEIDIKQMGMKAQKAVERLLPENIIPIMEEYYKKIISDFYSQKR